MLVSLDEREVLINSLWKVHDEPDFKVIAGDLRSKYAQPGAVSQHGNTIEIFLEADAHTLHTGEPLSGLTRIVFHVKHAARWHVSVDVARYSLYVSMWRGPVNWLDDNVLWETTRDHCVSRET